MAQRAAQDVLRQVALLQYLPADMRELVEQSFVPVRAPFGQEIVREGEAADALYVLVSGRARVLRQGEGGEEITLGSVRPGETFGAEDLLCPGLRTTTVRASADVEVLRLDRAVVDALILQRPEIRQYLELQARHRYLLGFLRSFPALTALSPEGLAEVLAALVPLHVPGGTTLIREGEPPGPMYIIEEGRCRVHTGVNGRRRNLAFLRPGEFFGELSVLRARPRNATVETVTPCRLLQLSPEDYQRLLHRHPGFRDAMAAREATYDARRSAQIPIDLAQLMLPAPGDTPGGTDPSAGLDAASGPAPAGATSPSTGETGTFEKRRRRIRRFPHLWQIDAMDCGAACLAMVCQHFGKTISRSRIRQVVDTRTDGASLRAICQGAVELGLAARGVKASASRLEQLPLPAIAHWEGNHWVVVYDVTRTEVRVSDPAFGQRRLSREEFEAKWTGYVALFDYTTAFEQNRESRPGVGWLLPFFAPYRGLLLRAALLALIASGLQMVVPLFTQVIVDRVVVERDVGLLQMLTLGMGLVILAALGATLIERYLLAWVAVRVDAGTLDFLTRRLLALPMAYFNTRRTGDIQRRLSGIWEIREFLVQSGSAALAALAQLAAAVGLMLVYSPGLTLVFLATVPVLLLVLVLSGRWLRPLYAELEENHGRYQSFQIDAIKGIETVKSLGAEGAFRDLMLKQFTTVARSRFRADFTLMSYQRVVQAVTLASVMLFLLAGASRVIDGTMSIGALVAFNALVALANGPIMALMGLWDRCQLASVYLHRLDDLLEQEPEQGADRARLRPVRSLEGRLAVRNLGFRYGGSGAPQVLEGVSFEIAPNSTVAVVGRSGSGKTTLVKLLAGLLEPSSGAILYDGVDLKTLNFRELRRKIGFVLQENHLFDDSIARNIAFGDEEPDLDRVSWAAQVAHAREFIERLPLGYETRIGESGILLSGGQRQRLAIARAVYGRPPILMFDEATSALDTESEQAVQENIGQVLAGRTAIVIAHRLSTVRHADLILVLEQGRLVEQGTHEELMRRQGLYYHLASRQLEL